MRITGMVVCCALLLLCGMLVLTFLSEPRLQWLTSLRRSSMAVQWDGSGVAQIDNWIRQAAASALTRLTNAVAVNL